MSDSYNSRLTPLSDKGLCGDPEYFDSPQSFDEKVASIVSILQSAQHVVVFTGAGISTASGIPDFRGPNGIWTQELVEKEKQSKPNKSRKKKNQTEENLASVDSLYQPPPPCPSFESARPSYTHYALLSLYSSGYISYLVSQNVDGLHIRSGFPRVALSEIHGNIFLECCTNKACNKEYFRSFDVKGMGCKLTGRLCEQCKAPLRDQTIDWDTPLPKKEMASAERNIEKADVILCLGSSLRVQPAGNFPSRVLRKVRSSTGQWAPKGHLILVNLQETHLDDRASVCLHHYCDKVMKSVCEKLGVKVELKHEEWKNENDQTNEQASNQVIRERLRATGRKKAEKNTEEEFPPVIPFSSSSSSESSSSKKRSRIEISKNSEVESTILEIGADSAGRFV
jgi:mono-ADP-ribosyltransferase sirtuin 6